MTIVYNNHSLLNLLPVLMHLRVESGSHLLTHLTNWPTEQSGYDPLVTHMLKFSF